MKKIIVWLIFFGAVLIVTGCSTNKITEEQNQPNETLSPTNQDPREDFVESEIPMSDFFYQTILKHIIRVKGTSLQNLMLN